jgi:hypothetical protein
VLALIANRPPSSWGDHDIDGFQERARRYGAMFRQLVCDRAATPAYLDVLVTLSRGELEQSEELVRRISKKLNGFRAEAHNPRILEAAFVLLAEKARSENAREKIYDDQP